jgi:hypothetical protein
MNSALQEQLEASLAELTDTRNAIEEIRRTAAEASVTERSKNRLLSVTVGSRGELQKLAFAGEGYRTLAPPELAQLIVDTIERAQAKCRQNSMAMLDQLLPAAARGPRLGGAGSFDELISQFVRRSGADLSDTELAEFDTSWQRS